MEAQNRRKGEHCIIPGIIYALQHPLVKNLFVGQDQGMVRVLVDKIEEVLKGEVLTDLSGRLFLDPEDIVRDEKLLDAAHPILDGDGYDGGLRRVLKK